MSAEDLIDVLMQNHPKGFDLSLDRVVGLLEKLGNPHLTIPPAIHVAGTNGKGSTVAFLRAILEANGQTVHVHTSPHLVGWHERFRIAGNPSGSLVLDQDLEKVIARVADVNAGKKITVFEILSCAMFLLFNEFPADYSLIEVGLGGRFDATNVINQPALCVITPVDLDHQAYLGNTLAKIAFEKAGIIKPDSVVVCGSQHDEAFDVIEERANICNARLISAQRNFDSYVENGRFIFQDESVLLDLDMPGLVGQHQIENAGLAIAAARTLNLDLEQKPINNAMKSVSWPARMQLLNDGKLVHRLKNMNEIWLDGGHNPAAGKVISSELKRRNPDGAFRTFMLCAMLNTKDPLGYFEAISDAVDEVICVPIVSSDAGINEDELSKVAKKAGIASSSMPSLSAAISKINQKVSRQPQRLIFAGSLYLAGDVLALNETPPQ